MPTRPENRHKCERRAIKNSVNQPESRLNRETQEKKSDQSSERVTKKTAFNQNESAGVKAKRKGSINPSEKGREPAMTGLFNNRYL